jgi:hypothetical protein
VALLYNVAMEYRHNESMLFLGLCSVSLGFPATQPGVGHTAKVALPADVGDVRSVRG